MDNINERAILASLNKGASCGGSNYHAFKALSELFGNKIAYNLNLHTNSTPLPLVILITFDYKANNNNNRPLPPTYEFKGNTYVISHSRVNIGPSHKDGVGHSMTGVIDASGKEFIFDAGFKNIGQFWEFEWTKGPIRDNEGDELAYFDGYDVFYVLEDLMTFPNKPAYVRPIPGRPPIRRVKKPVAAQKNVS
jgi:hypothetical protein